MGRNYKSLAINTLAAVSLTAGAIIGGAPQLASADTGSYASKDTSRTTTQNFQVDISNGYATLAELGPMLADFTPEQPRSDGGTRLGSYAIRTDANGATAQPGVGSYIGGPGCSIQCITSGIAYGRGVDAELVVKTHTAASVILMVTDNNGYVRVLGSGSDGYTFSAFFDDLESNTTYEVLAIAEDAQGYSSQAEGSFTTLTRNVEIQLGPAEVDDPPYGSDPFSANVWVNGDWAAAWQSDLEFANDWVVLDVDTFSFSDVPQHLELAVQLGQAQDPLPADCQAGGMITGPYILQGDCSVHAYASLADELNDLDDRPASASSWTEHTLYRTLVIPAGWTPALEFTVDVTLAVTYE